MRNLFAVLLFIAVIAAYVIYDVHRDSQVQLETVVVETVLKQVATVSNIEGNVVAKQESGEKRVLQSGSDLYVGDLVTTDDGAKAAVTFSDQSQVSIAKNSQFQIIEYDYGKGSESNINISRLLKGQLRIISGHIGKQPTDRYELRTHVTTIGIRGTNYAVRFCLRQECKIEHKSEIKALNAGLYMGVLEGEIVADSEAGETSIQAGQLFYQQRRDEAARQIAPIADVLFSAEELENFSKLESTENQYWILEKVE